MIRSLRNKLTKLYPFPTLVWYILVETALARAAFFMVMPFLALRLHGASAASPATIGVIIGMGPLVSTLIGFYVGHLSDLWGRRRIILGAIFLWVCVFVGFSFSVDPILYAILMGLSGLARGVFEPVSSALIADLCDEVDGSGELRKSAFHYRYFAVNLGASIGPLVGAWALLSHPVSSFYVTAWVYALSGIMFGWLSKRWGVAERERHREKATHRIKDVLAVLVSDRVLQIYILCFFLISFGYAQLETTMSIHVKDTFGDAGVALYGHLFAVNGLTIVLLTIPMMALAKRFDLNVSCAVSTIICGAGYGLFAMATQIPSFFVSMIVLTLGEIVVFANGYVLIEGLAPRKMKGAYLGTTNFAHAGFVIGPSVGGYILSRGGGMMLFGYMAILMVAAAGLFLVAKRRLIARQAPQ